jgi:parallel beta-helix repeat protein
MRPDMMLMLGVRSIFRADGISLACSNSTVSGNVILDATDGGIVIFGSPGSKVTGNVCVMLLNLFRAPRYLVTLFVRPLGLKASRSLLSLPSILALSRDLLGGINMVDYGPFNGEYGGVLVRSNTLRELLFVHGCPEYALQGLIGVIHWESVRYLRCDDQGRDRAGSNGLGK